MQSFNWAFLFSVVSILLDSSYALNFQEGIYGLRRALPIELRERFLGKFAHGEIAKSRLAKVDAVAHARDDGNNADV